MQFTIIRGYRVNNDIIPCNILAINNEDMKLINGANSDIEYGRIDDGVFWNVGYSKGAGATWIISAIPDLCGCVRDPRPNEEIFKLAAKNRSYPELKQFNDILDNLHFELVDGRLTILDQCGNKHVMEDAERVDV